MIPTPPCPKPTIENKTNVWNDHDKEVLKEVESHCERFYGEGYCIKLFIKNGENAYQVLCHIPVRAQGDK